MSAATATEALRRGDMAAARGLIDGLAAADPAVPPLRLQLALALVDRDQLVEALARLEALVGDVPRSALAWQALGAARRAADDADGAAIAFARSLALRPGNPTLLVAQAQSADDRGLPALASWRAALAADPASTPARLGLAVTLAYQQSVEDAEAVIRERLASEPNWREGWHTLLTLTFRWHGQQRFTAAAREAIESGPRNGALMLEVLRMLAQAGCYETVLAWAPEVRARIGDAPPLRLAEAEALDELGNGDRASQLLEQLAPLDEPMVDLARVRHALRYGKPDEAARIAGNRAQGPGQGVWIPYLSSAWRMLNDPRWQWLEGDPRLVGRYDLGLSIDELSEIALYLRTLHRGRHPPFQQSMRGGTQTEGNVLCHDAMAIRRLREALQVAVRDHVDQLPPADGRHPFLKEPRERFRFVGSWSVRLTGGGRHVNHVHSEGWLSSACYIALPNVDASDHAGWLTIGEPPTELGTGLAPTGLIRPQLGQVVLFPATMWHGTVPYAAGERLTVAFDVKPLR